MMEKYMNTLSLGTRQQKPTLEDHRTLDDAELDAVYAWRLLSDDRLLPGHSRFAQLHHHTCKQIEAGYDAFDFGVLVERMGTATDEAEPVQRRLEDTGGKA